MMLSLILSTMAFAAAPAVHSSTAYLAPVSAVSIFMAKRAANYSGRPIPPLSLSRFPSLSSFSSRTVAAKKPPVKKAPAKKAPAKKVPATSTAKKVAAAVAVASLVAGAGIAISNGGKK